MMNFDDPFSIEEDEHALKRLKKGKSGGNDGLQPKHLKYGGPALTVRLKTVSMPL